MSRFGLVILLGIVSGAALPPDTDALRDAQSAFDRGDFEQSLKHLDVARAVTADPGLVSYQRGCALAALQKWHDAEVEFTRSLDDTEAPAERRAKAHYNRGIARLNTTDFAASLRLAIDDFEACIALVTDAALKTDAQHNLEVAKLRWLKRQSQRDKSESPNESGATESNPTKSDPANASTGNSPSAAKATPSKNETTAAKPGEAGVVAGPPRPGAGSLPVIRDDSVLVPLTAEQTKTYLESVAERLLQQRRLNERLRSGPERPHLRDW